MRVILAMSISRSTLKIINSKSKLILARSQVGGNQNSICFCVLKIFLNKINIFNNFNVLIIKIIFKFAGNL